VNSAKFDLDHSTPLTFEPPQFRDEAIYQNQSKWLDTAMTALSKFGVEEFEFGQPVRSWLVTFSDDVSGRCDLDLDL